MVHENEIRENEVTVDPPPTMDAGFVFICSILAPWT